MVRNERIIMKKLIKTVAMALLVAVCLPLFASCAASPKTPPPSLDDEMEKVELLYSFGESVGEKIKLSADVAEAVYSAIDCERPVYPLSDLYELEKAEERLHYTVEVDSHAGNAEKDGPLSEDVLFDCVCKSNEKYLSDAPFGFSAIEDDYLRKICALICEVVEHMLEKHPDIDRGRVMCNLAHLKILYKTGMLDYASVNPDLVLSVSNTSASIAQTLKGEGAYRNVMIHEIMHVLQIGCPCESIGENATRRCGICIFWSDWDMNSNDWGWLFEGSAERNTCTYTGAVPLTYAYKVDYIASFETAVILRESVKADMMETLCFYSDPALLFKAFESEAGDARRELLEAMITVNILQMTPDAFYRVYEKKFGYRPDRDDETFNSFSHSLKVPVCKTLTRHFYRNLTDLLTEQAVSEGDVFFLINFFEGCLNMHLDFDSSEKKEASGEFFESYRAIRKAFFEAVGEGAAERYAAYEATAEGEYKICASLDFLPEEKRSFFIERVQRQHDLSDLLVKLSEE